MEFIDGEALDRVLARRGRLTWEEVVAYGKQLCKALQHAHEKGIIHRDLKPSNLMITPDGTLKLTDFGIAKDTDVTALTGANSTIGTAAYMSPEQCKGDKQPVRTSRTCTRSASSSTNCSRARSRSTPTPRWTCS